VEASTTIARIVWTTPFLVIGWLIGCLVKAFKLAKAAAITGFEYGVRL
jgi:hypothetical protein